jgi:hypothetical protein
MACPSFEHIVIYLITIAMRAIELSLVLKNIPLLLHLTRFTTITQVAHMGLSLIINIYATSIIALKAWCVRVHRVFRKHFVDRALIDNTTCAYIQEIPQVADGKWDRCPNASTGNEDIGTSCRVWCDSYSDRCKFRCRIQARVVTNFFFSSGHELDLYCRFH